MRLGRWEIKRGDKGNPYGLPGRGFIINYWMQDGKRIASYPVANKYCWPLYPWIIYKSVQAVLQHRRVHYGSA